MGSTRKSRKAERNVTVAASAGSGFIRNRGEKAARPAYMPQAGSSIRAYSAPAPKSATAMAGRLAATGAGFAFVVSPAKPVEKQERQPFGCLSRAFRLPAL